MLQVKPDIFNKMGPTLLDPKMAVSLAPQCFHNLIFPDALDAANGDFMFGKLPYYFGAGVLFVTGEIFRSKFWVSKAKTLVCS